MGKTIRGGEGRILRWLGASTLVHGILCAGAVALALALRAGNGREAVIKVALVTVASTVDAPESPQIAPGPAHGDIRRSRIPARRSGLRGREGAGATGRALPGIPAGGGPGDGDTRKGLESPGGAREMARESPNASRAARTFPSPDASDPPIDVERTASSQFHFLPSSGDDGDADEMAVQGRGGHTAGRSGVLGGGQGSGGTVGQGMGIAPGAGAGVAGMGPGGGRAAGRFGAPAAPRPPNVADLIAQIHRRIEGAKRYPEEARRQGIEGTVSIRFRIRGDGQAEAAEVVQSSGSRLLDEASLDTVHRAAPFPPVRGWVHVPLAYTLNEGHR